MQDLTGENLKFVVTKFSTLSLVVLLNFSVRAWHVRVENLTQGLEKLCLTRKNLSRVFNSRNGCMNVMHLLSSVAIRLNFELKTQPKTTFRFSLKWTAMASRVKMVEEEKYE